MEIAEFKFKLRLAIEAFKIETKCNPHVIIVTSSTYDNLKRGNMLGKRAHGCSYSYDNIGITYYLGRPANYLCLHNKVTVKVFSN